MSDKKTKAMRPCGAPLLGSDNLLCENGEVLIKRWCREAQGYFHRVPCKECLRGKE